jgi:hypothetical protein
MKKYYLILMLVTLLISGFSNTAFAASQEITIVNASDFDIYDLSITPSNNTTRGPNALKGQSLLSGQSVRVVFPNYDASIIHWDILGFNCCYEKHSWQQLNLNAIHTLTLREGGIAELN